jgi:hypothetical protein
LSHSPALYQCPVKAIDIAPHDEKAKPAVEAFEPALL